MRPMLPACLLLAISAVPAAEPPKEIPPSPSSVSGERIWPDPALTHWPAIAYPDESRNVAFALPNRTPGQAGRIGWADGEAMPITMPEEGDRASGLLPLTLKVGTREAVVELGTVKSTLKLRVADAREPWPLAGLKEGFPVDEQGVPVVLVDRRRRADEERKWGPLRGNAPRPEGRAVVVGDPLEALGDSAWAGLDADLRPALDERYPHHAVLVALAKLDSPRTIVWCPGNQALYGAAWSSEEERVLGAVRTRCEALGIQPRLVLAAPPLPLDDNLREQAAERRDLLVKSATVQGWMVLDLERIAGPAEQADKVRDGLFTRYPNGEAQRRVNQALRDELGR
jgi:hypothetical protein